jgi:hypothetical protein
MLGLAPDGVCLATKVTPRAGGLLHHRFTLTPTAHGRVAVCSLLHFAVESLRLGVTQHRALWSSDFPHSQPKVDSAIAWPTRIDDSMGRVHCQRVPSSRQNLSGMFDRFHVLAYH